MKAVALKSFRDKNTGAVYAPGEVMTLERSRFVEIQEKLGNSYIVEIVDPDAEPEEPENGIAEPEEPESDLTTAEAAKGRRRRKAEGGDGK